MSTTRTQARHRTTRRPVTPLTPLLQATTQNIGTAGRRTAVVAVSSGLAASLVGGAPQAFAAEAPTANNAAVHVGVSTETAPVVVVAKDAVWTVDAIKLKVKAAPEPTVPETPATTAATSSTERTSTAASRSTTRTPISASSSSTSKKPASDDSFGSKVEDIAKRYIGVPYVYGGSTPSGFDCSGFTAYVYAQLGIHLPRSSKAQRSAGKVVSAADAQPGDIIWSPGHVAIYLGGGKEIDAPRPGKSIQVRSIWQSNPVFLRVH